MMMVPRSVRRRKHETQPVLSASKSPSNISERHTKPIPVKRKSDEINSGTVTHNIGINSNQKFECVDPIESRTSEEDKDIEKRSLGDVIVIKDVLSDIVNKCVVTCQIDRTVTEAIGSQINVPLIYVGPLCYNNQVPVYNRVVSQMPRTNRTMLQNNNYTGLSWEPYRHSWRHRPRVTDGYYYGRQWEYTESGKWYMQRPARHRGFEFTVMSYNILAQDLLEDHSNMYCGSRHVLDWGCRRNLLLQELKLHMPDGDVLIIASGETVHGPVICLQEVQHNHFHDFFLPQLKAIGYDGVYLKRTGDKCDGCATFFQTKMFRKSEVIEVPYFHKNGGNVLDRDNVGLIVKLKPVSTSVSEHRTLVVANTHLLFNPRRGDVKLGQLMMLMAEIDKCAYYLNQDSSLYHPVIMCGDFNSQPHSELYKLIVMGHLDYEGIACGDISGQDDQYSRASSRIGLKRNFFPKGVGISDNCQYSEVVTDRTLCNTLGTSVNNDAHGTGLLQHQLRFVSAYKHWTMRNRRYYPEISTHHNRAACNVDYIFYGVQSGMVRFYRGEVETRNVQERHLSLLARYQLLTDREIKDLGSLPNKHFGSDHLALMVKFLLT